MKGKIIEMTLDMKRDDAFPPRQHFSTKILMFWKTLIDLFEFFGPMRATKKIEARNIRNQSPCLGLIRIGIRKRLGALFLKSMLVRIGIRRSVCVYVCG